LRGGEAARLQRLSQLAEQLADLAASVAGVVVTVVMRLRCLTLKVLLDFRIILLCGRGVPGLEVGGELVEILGESAGALG